MDDISINTNDEIIIKLLHYFVTEENYSPIVLKGAQNEIWLEKLDGDYKVVRLVSNYIHNNEQLNVDLFRTKQIMKRIKKKTMSFSLNALSIFVNLGDNVNISEAGNADIDCVKVSEVEDLNNYEFILDNFPTITKKTVFKEEGMELFVRLTNEIGKKNEKEQKQAEDIFAPKDPIVTKVLLTINFIIFIACILGIGDTIVNLGVNHLGSVQHGQLWRLVTAGFIHVNLMHFAFNAYALYLIGPQIEQFYGRTKYLIIYIGSIIIGNLLSLLFLGGNVALGASGGIFGLLGAILYFGYHYRVYLDGVVKSQILPIIFLNLAIGFMVPGIDNAAHVGGLLGGGLLSAAVGLKYKGSKDEKINGIILTTIFVGFLVFMIFFR